MAILGSWLVVRETGETGDIGGGGDYNREPGRREMGDGRWETGDRRQMGDREKGVERQEDVRQGDRERERETGREAGHRETRDGRQGVGRRETGTVPGTCATFSATAPLVRT